MRKTILFPDWAMPVIWHTEANYKNCYELKFVYLKPTGLPPLNLKSDNCHLWIAAIDEKLNEKNYIVPGLGDAGDLAYGSKL